MVLKYRSITGTNDILPENTVKWQYLEDKTRALFDIFGYREIRTPILEPTELFIRSVGPDTDIVEKEMYTFMDQDKCGTSLRPEETAGVVRAYLENSLYTKQSLWKLYYIGPMFRRERPQAGRYRQFHQIGAEVIGSYKPSADAETLIFLRDYFEMLGVADVVLNLSSSGCLKCRPGYAIHLRESLESSVKDMCTDCQRRYKRNIFRVLDCKHPQCRKVIEKLPIILDFLCSDCSEHFEELKMYLNNEKVVFEITPHLVRGLDYYTKTVYEFIHRGLGSQNAVAAGGRYDLLVKQMSGPDTGAVGFSIGMERLLSLLKDFKVPENKIKIYLVSLGKESYNMNFELLEKLRKDKISSDMDYEGKSIKAQMRAANRLGADFVVVRGEDEIKKSMVMLKDMRNSTEEQIKEADIVEVVKRKIKEEL